LQFRIVIDLEMVRRVDVPIELVVVNQVLAEVGNKGRPLRGRGPGCTADDGRCEQEESGRTGREEATRGDAHAHRQYLWMGNLGSRDLTCDAELPANAGPFDRRGRRL